MCLLNAKRKPSDTPTITCYKVMWKLHNLYVNKEIYSSCVMGFNYLLGKEYKNEDLIDSRVMEELTLSPFIHRVGCGAFHTFKRLEDARSWAEVILKNGAGYHTPFSVTMKIAVVECRIEPSSNRYVFEGKDETTGFAAYASSNLWVIKEVA